MAYFDLDTVTDTPEQEEERRRRLLGAIVGTPTTSVLQPRTNQPPPALRPGYAPDSMNYDLSVNATNQPKVPPMRNLPSPDAPQIGSPRTPSFFPSPLDSPARPGPPDVRPTREDYPAKPELSGWKKYLGLALSTLSNTPAQSAEGILHGRRDEAERQYQGAVQDWERGQSDEMRQAQIRNIDSEIEARKNPKPDKPGAPHYQTDDEGNLHAISVGPDGKPIDQVVGPNFGKPQTPPKDNKAVAGTIDGKPAWGVQTEKGWIDPQTQQSIPTFKPAPNFAQTGFYEPVQIPVAGGGMAPGAFNKRTGIVSQAPAGQPTAIPRAAQKEIDDSLMVARGMERLERSQGQILQEVEKRGQQGPLGGGPYLNGPESMQFLSNHIAMTFGAVKGARVGRDIIQEHLKARDLDQATEALAQRVLSGGVITYTQAQQMMETAKINRRQAWRQAQDAAQQYGVPDAVKVPADLGGETSGTSKGGFKPF